MARGGIYDQLGGGFHRYSVDERWLVPHFEKMLYDNASGVAVPHGYKHRRRRLRAHRARDARLRHPRDARPGGGFYPAGRRQRRRRRKVLPLARAEVRALLSPAELAAVARTFGVTAAGNFGGANILHLVVGDRVHRSALLAGALAKLAAARSRRVRPRRDDKVITAWNGLMIGVLARAACRLDEPRYAVAAARAARFVLRHSRGADGALVRRWRAGDARQRATLRRLRRPHRCADRAAIRPTSIPRGCGRPWRCRRHRTSTSARPTAATI